MKLVVTIRAANQVAAIHDYIAQHNPKAAKRVADGIYARVATIAESGFGNLGRRSRTRGTRHVVEAPYVIVYRHDERRDEITVLSVVHGARRR